MGATDTFARRLGGNCIDCGFKVIQLNSHCSIQFFRCVATRAVASIMSITIHAAPLGNVRSGHTPTAHTLTDQRLFLTGPTHESLRHYAHWQQQQGALLRDMSHRFLYPGQMPAVANGDASAAAADATNGNATGAAAAEETLPDGWERRMDQSGRIYFVNHKNKTTQWEDPRTQGKDCIVDGLALPQGWEQKTTAEGQTYFVDHNTKSTTFQDPRRGRGGPPALGRTSFKWKITQFRYLCHCECSIRVAIMALSVIVRRC